MAGLDWRDDQPFRNASKARIHREIDDSLRGLRRRVIAAGLSRPARSAPSGRPQQDDCYFGRRATQPSYRSNSPPHFDAFFAASPAFSAARAPARMLAMA
jgi:hypothetical protein